MTKRGLKTVKKQDRGIGYEFWDELRKKYDPDPIERIADTAMKLPIEVRGGYLVFMEYLYGGGELPTGPLDWAPYLLELYSK